MRSRKAREELRKQFMAYVQSLAKGFQRPQTYEDIDGVIKLRKAIDTLDPRSKTTGGRASPLRRQLIPNAAPSV